MEEGTYSADLVQFVTNALYRVHDNDMQSMNPVEFDKWVEAQIEAMDKYIKELHPVSPDKAIITKQEKIDSLKKEMSRFKEDHFGQGWTILDNMEESLKHLESELTELKKIK
jgi:superoxide dismutase